MSFEKIEKALEKAVISLATDIPDIVAENTPYKPVLGTPYIKLKNNWSSRRPASIGPNARTRYDGILFVDLFFPGATGAADAIILADDITNSPLFKQGNVLLEDDIRTHIRYAERQTALEETDWYHIPVTISWYSYGAS